jgi:hypothetical protein
MLVAKCSVMGRGLTHPIQGKTLNSSNSPILVYVLGVAENLQVS